MEEATLGDSEVVSPEPEPRSGHEPGSVDSEDVSPELRVFRPKLPRSTLSWEGRWEPSSPEKFFSEDFIILGGDDPRGRCGDFSVLCE